MTSPRDVMQTASMAALAGYLEATGQRHDTQAAQTYLDRVIKAWERTQPNAAAQPRRDYRAGTPEAARQLVNARG